METFTSVREPVDNPDYDVQRRQALARLDLAKIDAPIVTLVQRFNDLPYCFTLQSCCGHFLSAGQRDPHNVQVLPTVRSTAAVDYRIAYLALCIDRNDEGISLLTDLSEIAAIDPGYIQFGCAEWFWERQVNSYALQVEPKRYQARDSVSIAYEEALHVQTIRDTFFAVLERLLDVSR